MRPLTKSITWRLQFWHATILLVVVAGLSTAWFIQTRRARMSEIDAELLSAARVLDGSLRGFRLPRFVDEDASDVQLSPADSRRLSLPRNPVGNDDVAPMYFAIWLKDGRLLKSDGLPKASSADNKIGPSNLPVDVAQRDKFREVHVVGPTGTRIVVGQDISRELGSLRRLAGQIAAISIGILSVGLIGGWWLSRAVLRPIDAMSQTANQFSVSNMSPRIDIVETESELGELAQILNDAFDRVQSSFEQQQQFAADASHELRTPLAVIQSQIELSLKRERDPKEYVKTLKTCAEAGNRLSELVESLLALARMDSSDQQTEYSEVRLDRITEKCVDLMRPVAQHAEVDISAEAVPASMLGNAKQLERAIENLIKNSIAYNRPGGSVQLTVKASSTQAELTIRDTGVGISEEHLSHVTERFYRVDKARSRHIGGSGLGLSIAKRIVEAHQGTLTIDSVMGEGTSVTLRFAAHSATRSELEK